MFTYVNSRASVQLCLLVALISLMTASWERWEAYREGAYLGYASSQATSEERCPGPPG